MTWVRKKYYYNSLTRKLSKERAKQILQTKTRKTHKNYPYWQNVSLETRNIFELQNDQDKVLDKEATN